MSTCQRIWIEAIGLGGRGQRYRVTHNGVTLIEGTKNPEFDLARALLVRGIVGQVEIWRQGANLPAMRFDVEKAASMTPLRTGSFGAGRKALTHPPCADQPERSDR